MTMSRSDDMQVGAVISDTGSGSERNTVHSSEFNRSVRYALTYLSSIYWSLMTFAYPQIVQAGSSLPISDPVPAYEPRNCVAEEIKPGYVSQEMYNVWQAAQAVDEKERPDGITRSRSTWLKVFALGESRQFSQQWHVKNPAELIICSVAGTCVVVGTNAAIIYCSIIFMQRLMDNNDTMDDKSRGLIMRISGLSDNHKLSHGTLAKAAVLSGLLTTLPAVIIGLFAIALKEKLDKVRHASECTVD